MPAYARWVAQSSTGPFHLTSVCVRRMFLQHRICFGDNLGTLLLDDLVKDDSLKGYDLECSKRSLYWQGNRTVTNI
jgi:hypothetical protein